MSEAPRDPERQLHADRLRELGRAYAEQAEQFRTHGLTETTRPERVASLDIDSDAGALVVACFRRGWLNAIDGLADLIDWLDGGEHPSGETPTLVRSPYNVFLQLHTLLAIRNPACFPGRTYLQELAHCEDSEAAAWNALRLADREEQNGRACQLLAYLIEHDQPATNATPVSEVGQQDGSGPVGFTPTEADLNIMQALAESPNTLTQQDIEAASGEPRSTVAKVMPRLEKAGLVERPHGLNKGYTLTPEGRRQISARLKRA